MEVSNTARFADGMDLGLIANKNTAQKVRIGVASSMNQAVTDNFIAEKVQDVAPKRVSLGSLSSALEWTRILFNSQVNTEQHEKLYVSVTIDKAILAKDLGPKNGNFYTVTNGRVTEYPDFDLAMRLLVSGLNSNHINQPSTPTTKPGNPGQNTKPTPNITPPGTSNTGNAPDTGNIDNPNDEKNSDGTGEEKPPAGGSFGIGLLISLMLLLRQRTHTLQRKVFH